MAGEPSRIGPYTIGKRLGQGGMGAVYEAVHDTIGRRAAVKFLNAGLAGSTETLNRFFNEARAVSVVEHPGLVQIYDSGQLPDGTAYIIMELIRGDTLAERLKRGGRLSTGQVLRLGGQLADALAAVHEYGIVHRDIKPANLMIVGDAAATGRERLKVLDFGIAKLAQGIGAGETRPGQVMGSPLYMAPEQCRGAAGVDAKADCYAVGAVLYHMLAGRPPFDGETFAGLIFQHLHEPPEPLSARGVDAPPALLNWVMSLLDKDPKQRPTMRQTAERFEALLQEFAGQLDTGPVPLLAEAALGAGDAGDGGEAAGRGPGPLHTVVASPGDGVDPTRVEPDVSSTLGNSVGQAPAVVRRPMSRAALGAAAMMALLLVATVVLVWRAGRGDRPAVSTVNPPDNATSAASFGGSKPMPPAQPASGTSPASGVADKTIPPTPPTVQTGTPAAPTTPAAKSVVAKPPQKVATAQVKPTPKSTAAVKRKKVASPSGGAKSLGAKKGFPIIQ